MIVNVTNIKWDIDGEEEDIELPSSVGLFMAEDTNLEDEVSQELSDRFGWCVLSCDYEAIPSVICSICREECSKATAHQHQDDWIGDECCWDESFKAS